MQHRMGKVAGLAVVALAVTACGGGASGDDVPAATAARTTATVTSTGAEPSSSGESAGPSGDAAPSAETTERAGTGGGTSQGQDPGVQCGVDTDAPAITAALGVLSERQPSQYGWNYIGDANYDPCADLSYAMAETPRGTVSSPMQLMLFHRGKYVGTGTWCAQAYTTVIGGTDSSVDVRYRWTQGNDANANPSGEATTTYRWAGGGVEMMDPLPAALPTEC